ncbi:MAG: hypothetical protein KBD63_08200 [Bacteriovoracaceae bacterium]|nr:hypothetical protein [Bacteriovoracaceae bacterium]
MKTKYFNFFLVSLLGLVLGQAHKTEQKTMRWIASIPSTFDYAQEVSDLIAKAESLNLKQDMQKKSFEELTIIYNRLMETKKAYVEMDKKLDTSAEKEIESTCYDIEMSKISQIVNGKEAQDLEKIYKKEKLAHSATKAFDQVICNHEQDTRLKELNSLTSQVDQVLNVFDAKEYNKLIVTPVNEPQDIALDHFSRALDSYSAFVTTSIADYSKFSFADVSMENTFSSSYSALQPWQLSEFRLSAPENLIPSLNLDSDDKDSDNLLQGNRYGFQADDQNLITLGHEFKS